MDQQKLIDMAYRAGINQAVIIPADAIVLNAAFRDTCQANACGKYGRCWMCPPDIGDIETLMSAVRHFQYGLLYQTIGILEDSYDVEGMDEAAKAHVHAGLDLDELLSVSLPERLHLSCGGCRICDRCSKADGLPCRFPELALSSMEAYGIDVYNTCKSTPLKYINGQNTVTYFGIVLF